MKRYVTGIILWQTEMYIPTNRLPRMIQELLGKKHVLHTRIPLGLVNVACHCSEWIGKLLNKGMTLNTDKYIILKQRNWICDVAPLQDELGFTPEYPLRKGLEEVSNGIGKKDGYNPL